MLKGTDVNLSCYDYVYNLKRLLRFWGIFFSKMILRHTRISNTFSDYNYSEIAQPNLVIPKKTFKM